MCISSSDPIQGNTTTNSSCGTCDHSGSFTGSASNKAEPSATLQVRGFSLLFRWVGLILVSFYRAVLAPSMGGVCRFEPSCSRYAEEAFRTHRPVQALFLTVRRLLRCRPGGPFGYDPVPQVREDFKSYPHSQASKVAVLKGNLI